MIAHLLLAAFGAISPLHVQGPINYCIADDVSHAQAIRVALNSPVGWRAPLTTLGVSVSESCPGNVRFRTAPLGSFGAIPQEHLTAVAGVGSDGVCIVTINNASPNWESYRAPVRQSVIYHEFAHCLGLLDGEGTIMSYPAAYPRVPAEAKRLLLERWAH